MSDLLYHILIFAVAIIAIGKGFKRGFTGQVCAILGFAFGIVCAHIFLPQGEDFYRMILPGIKSCVGASFIYSVISAVSIYVIVFYLFKALTKVLRSAMEVFHVGMLDSILGAAFSLVKYLLVLSIFLNLLLCVSPNSTLMKYAEADDGNIVEGVVLLAPALLGCFSAEDLSHILQLREAKKISVNRSARPLVIQTDVPCSGQIIYENNA